jgi:PKD repeat protein
MSKSRIPVVFILLLSLFSFFVSTSFAKNDNKKPKIKWSPEKVEISAEGGESFSIDFQFESKKSLSKVSLWAVPELQPYISVTPSYFKKIRKGRTYSVNIDVSIPYDTEIGLYNGTIYLREKHKRKDDDGSSDDKYEKHKHKEKHKSSSDDKSSDDGSSDDKYKKHKHGSHTIPETLKIELSIVDDDDDGDGYTDKQGDCDDTDPAINPDAQEVCDGKDNDCDGQIDETEIHFTSPVDGSTINSSSTLVTGTINACSQEVGIIVNGILAEIAGSEFAANDIFLEIGANTLTAVATDKDGNTATDTITVFTGLYQDQVNLFSNVTSGISPLDVKFSIDTQISNQITTYKMDFDGDGPQDATTVDPDNISFTYEEGLYYPTITVVDDQDNQYTDTIAINVLSLDEMDTLLKAKWEDFGAALINSDIEDALELFEVNSREFYRKQFTAFYPILNIIGNELGNLQLVAIKDNRAEYEIIVTREDVTYSFYLLFVKDIDGIWRIRVF